MICNCHKLEYLDGLRINKKVNFFLFLYINILIISFFIIIISSYYINEFLIYNNL